MNIERIYADADLSRGLAAAALTTDTSEFDLVNTKLAELSAAKTVKLNALAPQEVPNIFAPKYDPSTVGSNITGKEDAYANLDNTITTLPDGRKESNANKIWNDYSHEELQMKLGDIIGNYAVTVKDGKQYQMVRGTDGNLVEKEFVGPTRRLYSYLTDNGEVKFGLSTSKYDSSDARYQAATGWLPGPKGVNLNKNVFDVLLPYDKATELEGIIHGNKNALEQRVVNNDDLAKRKEYGSGSSEYYTSIDNVLGDTSNSDLSNIKIPQTPSGLGLKLQPKIQGMGALRRSANLGKEVGAVALNLIAGTADTAVEMVGKGVADTIRLFDKDNAVADTLDKIDLGTGDQIRDWANKAVGYDDRYSAQPMQALSAEFANAYERGALNKSTPVQILDSLAKNTENVPLLNQITAALAAIGQTVDGATADAVVDSLKLVLANPETTVQSLGEIAMMVSGKGKGFTALNKTIRTEQIAAVKATDAAQKLKHIENVAELNKQKTLLDVGAKLTSDNLGVLALAANYANQSEDEFITNTGRSKTYGERIADFAVSAVMLKIDEIVGVGNIKGVKGVAQELNKLKTLIPDAAYGKIAHAAISSVARLGAAGTKEFFEELAQSTQQEMLNYDLVGDGFTVKPIDASVIRNITVNGVTGAIAGFAGGVHMAGPKVAWDTVQDIRNVIPTTIKKEKSTVADTKAAELLGEEDVTDEERMHMAQVISDMEMDDYDFTTDTKDVLDNFYRAEDTYRRLAAVSKNPEGVKTVGEALDKVRNRILSVVDNVDESKPFILKSSGSEFKLGNVEQDTSTTAKPNVEAAEALVEFVLENSPTLEAKRDAKLLKIATDNGMAAEKYRKLKSYYEVETEAVEGKRGYRGYERTLKALSAATSPNTKALDKAVKDAQGFWQSQINAVTEFEYGIKEAENRAAAANATGIAPRQVKVAAKQKVGSFEFTINYSSKPVNGKTVYSVHESAYNVLNAKKRNIVGIANALANVSKYIKEKKLDIDVGTSAGISVPATSKAEAQKYRDNDQKFYNRVGVTKVILDTTVPKTDGKVKKSSNDYKKWDKDYRSMNLSKINKDEYTKDDVVLINARTVVTKNGDKYKRKFADDKVAARVKDAMKAGATIVIDNDIIRKDQATYKNLVLLLGKFSSKEHKYSRVTTEDGKVQGAYIFKPEAQAKKINEEIKVKTTAAKELKKIETKAKDELLLAVVDTRLNREGAAARLAEAKKAARAYFKDTNSGTVDDNMMKYANRVLDKEIDAGAVQLLEEIKQALSGVELTDDNIQVYLNSREFAEIKLAEKVEGRKTISSKGIVELAETKAKEYAMRAKDIRNMFQEWKQYTEEAKAGDTDLTLEQWLKTKHYEGKEAINLKDTISAGLGTVYVKLNDTKSFTKKAFGGKSKGQALELDISNIVKVANTTVLNTIDIATIKDVSPQLASEIDTAVAKIQKILDVKKYTSEEKLKSGDGETELTAQEFALADSPGIALLLHKDGSINETAVAALVLSIHNAYKNSGYMLSTKTKSSEDLARMLGVRPEEINYKTAKAISELGMLTKSLATDIRKDIAAKLGMTRNAEGIEDKRYDQAMTDLAQVAIAIGVENGVLKYYEMNIDKYEEDVLGMSKEEIAAHSRGRSPDVKVSFVKLVNDDVLKTGKVVDYDELVADLPMEDVYRQEPMFVKPSNRQIEARLEKVRNEKVGTKIPKESKDLMTKGMKAEHTADVTRINDLLGEKYVDKIKKRMGWIGLDSAEYANLSQDKKDIQEAINRDVEKEINELLKLTNKSNDEKSVKLWFMIDFIKNGRYMYDSNTINPQTQKQLTRWLVQPSDHTKTVTYTNGKFMVDGKDHTDAYMIALGQALGFPVDKKRLASTKNHIEQLLPKLLDKDSTRLDTLFEEMLDNKVVVIDGLKVEIEHIAHAHQAIEMLKSIRDTGKATSALTAEIDAKTSGFGIKSALMPIIESITERLRAVGIDIGKDKSASKAITDYLDNGADSIKDMYQELGSTMTKKGLDINDNTTKSVIGKNITAHSLTGIFSKIHNFLPNLDGGVPTEIRNLFKQPFMEFNYSAALRTIRKSLALEMAHQAAEAAMKDATKFVEMGFDKITGMKHAQFVAEMKVTNLKDMYYGTYKKAGNDLETRIAAALDLVYGTQVEAAFTKNFAAGIQAQGVINQAYQAMFKQYKKVYDNELAKLRQSNDGGKAKGAVSAKQYKDLLKRLHRMFPTIRGPLASVETYDENTAIYSTVTATADSNESGTGPSHVAVNSAWSVKHGRQYKGKGISSSTLQYEIKQFEEAMSAGSVVPIHYFDGSLMALTGLRTDANLTMIHDAIMAPITEMFSVARSYNKAFYDLALGNNRYNIVEELQKSLERVTTEVAKYAKDNPSLNLMGGEVKVRLRKFDDEVGKKVEEQIVEFVKYIKTAAEELQKLRDMSDAAHTKLTKDIEKYGITVSNLVTGSDEGSYTRSGKAEAKVKDVTILKDSKEKIFEDLAKILSTASMNKIKILMEGCE